MQDSNISIISQGLDLMLYGMGTVFIFLTIMVFVLMLLTSIVRKFPGAPDATAPQNDSSSISAKPAVEPVDPDHIKAIEQAIKLFRQS